MGTVTTAKVGGCQPGSRPVSAAGIGSSIDKCLFGIILPLSFVQADVSDAVVTQNAGHVHPADQPSLYAHP